MTCPDYERYRPAFQCIERYNHVCDVNSTILAHIDKEWGIDVLRVTRTSPGRYTVSGLLTDLQIIEYGCDFAAILEWLRIVSDLLSAHRLEYLYTTRNIVGTDGFQESDLRFPLDDIAASRGWQDTVMCIEIDAVPCSDNISVDVCGFI